MKIAFLVVALGLLAVVARPLPAAALDCARAEQPVEKMLCSTPGLKQADDDMSAAYFKLLRETTDPDFHALLIRSQQRWLEQRSHGRPKFELEDEGTADGALLDMTRDRLDVLSSGRPIRVMEEQRKIASKDTGGPFAGYQADCGFWPPSFSHGAWAYVCWSSVYRQHHDRICSVAEMWTPPRSTDRRLVSVVENGKPRMIAGCSIGSVPTNHPCPDPYQSDELQPVAHWTTNPNARDFVPPPDPKDLWKYDPDLAGGQYDQPWMNECLSAPVFPPPESSRP